MPSNLTSSSESIEGKSLGKEDIVDLLAGEDAEPEAETTTKEKEDKEVEPEEEGGEKEIELEEAEEIKAVSEEDEELELPIKRKEILKKYPNLFKEFPHLERSYYRAQQYAEVVPTIEDAREAVDKAETLDTFESQLMDGKTDEILKVVFENDKQAFSKIVDDYLPALARVDQGAYYHVLSNVIKQTTISMVKEARRTGNDQLLQAGQLLNQFVFGTSDFEPPKQLSRPAEIDEELHNERMQWMEERFESALSDLNTTVDNVLKSTIDVNIDPRGAMTDYVKGVAIERAQQAVQESLDNDPSTRRILDRLWEKAASEKFSKSSLSAIRAAYLSKAKLYLRPAIQKSRNEALKGLGKRVADDEVREDRSPIRPGRSTSPSSKVEKGAIPKGMKTFDFLNQD